jgi:hypothetical protein
MTLDEFFDIFAPGGEWEQEFSETPSTIAFSLYDIKELVEEMDIFYPALKLLEHATSIDQPIATLMGIDIYLDVNDGIDPEDDRDDGQENWIL